MTPIRSRGLIAVLLAAALIAGVFLTATNASEHEDSSTPRPTLISEEKVELKGVDICFECHDEDQTVGFHYPEKIMKIEAKKGLRRRICMDCHGKDGANPDKKMTEERLISFDEGKNQFRVKSEAVHGIHLDKLNKEIMVCETCHLIQQGEPTKVGDELVIPIPKAGQILVCEMCHIPSDNGNYIRIHITSGHQECTTCHTGDIKEVHKRATAKLGQF